MAKRRVARRGRAVLGLTLLGFVLISAGVIWRRAYGISQSRELRALEDDRVQLEARRADLEADIREASSRAKLAPIAERRLNMRVATDSQLILLPRLPQTP